MRLRQEFGQYCEFADSKIKEIDIKGDPEDAKQWVERTSTTVELDCVNEFAAHEVNTDVFEQCPKSAVFTQGAWPAKVKANDFQDRQRYLQRVTATAGYQGAIPHLIHAAESVILQNNTIDLYETYFDETEFEMDTEPPSAKTVCLFRDPTQQRRSCVQTAWNPDGSFKLATAYCDLAFQGGGHKKGGNAHMTDEEKEAESKAVKESSGKYTGVESRNSSFIWDVNSPNEPELELRAPSPLCSLVYNHRNSDQLAGGCYNGLVGFWDTRKGSTPVMTSQVENSHRDPVYSISFVQSRTGNECCSVSTDGLMLWWDVRNLDQGPTDQFVLEDPVTKVHYSCTSLSYRPDAGATRYLVGTEQGMSLLVERKAKKDAKSQKSFKSTYGTIGRLGHHGPVYTIARNPFAPKLYLTVGDWSTRLWSEDIKAPIMLTHYERAELTAAAWSPTRPCVYFNTRRDGSLDMWDLYHRHDEPSFRIKMGSSPLLSICAHKEGKFLALGSEDGRTSVVKLSKGLYTQQRDEKQMVQDIMDRERERERTLELRRHHLHKLAERKRKLAMQEAEKPKEPEPSWEERTSASLQAANEHIMKSLDALENDDEKKGGGEEDD